MPKKKVLVIIGGKSGEHEVSVRSGKAIASHLDPEKYEVSFLGITKQGEWIFKNQLTQLETEGKVLPSTTATELQTTTPSDVSISHQFNPDQFDIVFPALHGTNGEDGRLQGLLEMSNIPYVGSGVTGSAVSMDKVIQKTICKSHSIPQVEFVSFTQHSWLKEKDVIRKNIENNLTFPIFVKPANLGSSVGVVKVKSMLEIDDAITDALKFDTKIIAENGVEGIKEIEVSVLGNYEPTASVCGAIIPHTEFYDYETKYITDDIEVEIPAKIPEDVAKKIQQTAVEVFKILDCKGLARVDFFYQPSTGKYFLNELNTMPGFTSISMYPKLWEASGVPFSELVDRLIGLGLEEWSAKQALQYSYQPKLNS